MKAAKMFKNSKFLQYPDGRDESLPIVKSWRGKWIWLKDCGDGMHDYICFRKEFLLEDKADNPVIHITAEREYILWVNGHFAGRGPFLSDPKYKRYDSFRIRDLFKPGKNIIGVMVYHHSEKLGASRLTPHQEACGFLCQIDDGNNTLLVSNQSWKTARNKAYLRPSVKFDDGSYHECYNASAFSSNWNEESFDASPWQNAVSCMQEKHPLWGSTIPQNRFFPWVNLIPSETGMPGLTKRLPKNVSSGEVIQRREFSASDGAVRMSLEEVLPSTKASVLNISSLTTAGKGTVSVKNSDYFESEDTFDGIRNATIILDFGRLMNARFGFRFRSPANVKIDIGYAWNLEGGRIIPYVSSRTPQADCYLSGGDMQEWQTFQWRHFRYIQLTFRDLMETLELFEVWAEEVEHQFPEAVEFSSDCELLNRSWKATENTIRLCCANNQTMDNPSRERKQYLGDCSAIVPAIDQFFGETALVKKYFHQFDESQHRSGLYRYSTGHDDDGASLFDHSLALPIRLYEHYMRFGDDKLVLRMMPGIRRFMELSESILDSSGIAMLPPYGIWFDWACVKRENISFILNALTARAFISSARLAAYVGCGDKNSEVWNERANKIICFLRENFYDKKRSVYVDCLMDNGTRDPFVSEHSNSLAVLWGIADIGQSDAIMNAYQKNRKLFSSASPAWKYLPEAFIHAHRTDLMVDWIKRKYGPVLDAGYDTLPETWCLYGENTLGRWRCRNSRAVAQGAGLGLPDTVVHGLAGIVPLEPGFAKVGISPKPGSLRRFSVAVPGPDGIYSLQYSADASENIYKITVPAGKDCKFIINEPELPANVLVNGTEARPDSENKTFNNETSFYFNLKGSFKESNWKIIVKK
ncbi:MAG: hypothetical protein A2017_04740 [Lentisphaerae bacterium GWF2_44_16]|nr:MAG: hypothetical protein A2017_04740 [Lentisphaerae bacterium GWF2_44_16]